MLPSVHWGPETKLTEFSGESRGLMHTVHCEPHLACNHGHGHPAAAVSVAVAASIVFQYNRRPEADTAAQMHWAEEEPRTGPEDDSEMDGQKKASNNTNSPPRLLQVQF